MTDFSLHAGISVKVISINVPSLQILYLLTNFIDFVLAFCTPEVLFLLCSLYLCCTLKTIIIAGGKGTRLHSIHSEVPKPLIPVAGKPVLQYQLEMLAAQGFTDVLITINHLGHKIQDFVGRGEAFGLQVTYLEETTPLGTAGALAGLQNSFNEPVLILYGDVIMDMDINRLLKFHKAKMADASLVVHPNDHPYDSDLLECDSEGKVTRFLPKPHQPDTFYRNLVNAAVYIFEPKVFSFIKPNTKQDFGKDIFPQLIQKARVYAYNTTEYIKDMGTPDRIGAVENDIISGKVKRKSYFYPQKAIFLDRDGVLNEDTDFIKTPEEFELYDYTAAALKRINKSEFVAVVVTNQSAVARNLCSEEELRIIHNKMETRLGEAGAKVDAIYYCPHHPDKGYPDENPIYKIDCECRKPKPGMLKQAAAEFNIDLTKSYMIGDSDRDKEAGRKAGCVTLGVRSGKGCADLKSDPDFLFENLSEAVDFILDEPLLPYFNELNALYHQCGEAHKPFVILVGGQSRSGKSTLSSYLRIQFQKEGKKVLQIKADDWIMPAADRTGKESVWERFRMQRLEKDLHSLFNGETISVQKYDSKTRKLREEMIYHYAGQDVVIIEGAPLLMSDSLLNLADVSVFVELHEDERKNRFTNFYRWKGFHTEAIESLYLERKNDEYPEINKTKNKADFIIKTK